MCSVNEQTQVMGWKKEYLDLILVPSGLLIMCGYHLFLLYRCLRLPQTTVIGYENHNKKAWVERMMQGDMKNTGLALEVISSNTSAATFLSSVCLTLSSLIGAWIGSSSDTIFTSNLIYGDRKAATLWVKYISLLSFLLVAFASFVQATRYYVHANFLISTPDSDIPVKYVQSAVIRGSNFTMLGHRALYFATTLLMWIFGPCPMFISSVVMVGILHFLDTNSIPLHQYSPPKQQFGRNIGGKITIATQAV